MSLNAPYRAAVLCRWAIESRRGQPVQIYQVQRSIAGRSLKDAALDGNVTSGKTEAGQSAGLIDDIVPAGELVERLVRECEAARAALNGKWS